LDLGLAAQVLGQPTLYQLRLEDSFQDFWVGELRMLQLKPVTTLRLLLAVVELASLQGARQLGKQHPLLLVTQPLKLLLKLLL
jgi:hypothetical protein